MDLKATGQVVIDLAQELHDRVAAVVAGHIGMQVQPQPLDSVLVRAIGRQEVEPVLRENPIALAFEPV